MLMEHPESTMHDFIVAPGGMNGRKDPCVPGRLPSVLKKALPLKHDGAIDPDCEVGIGGTASPADADNAVTANRVNESKLDIPKRRRACGTNHALVGSGGLQTFAAAGATADAIGDSVTGLLCASAEATLATCVSTVDSGGTRVSMARSASCASVGIGPRGSWSPCN